MPDINWTYTIILLIGVGFGFEMYRWWGLLRAAKRAEDHVGETNLFCPKCRKVRGE